MYSVKTNNPNRLAVVFIGIPPKDLNYIMEKLPRTLSLPQSQQLNLPAFFIILL
jgi:hypothetical protein